LANRGVRDADFSRIRTKEHPMSAKKNPTTPKRATTKKPKTAKVAPPTATDAVVGQPEAPATPAPTDAAKKPAKAKAADAKPKKAKKLSALDAAAKVLADAGQAMSCPDLIEAMTKKGLWSSPNGLTPAATLYAAILREVKVKGADARFVKTERGKFSFKAPA
jgi:hypothetical protein